MNEAKSIESAVTRAQQTGHVQPPAPDLEERRRRFELQRARERAEKERQGQVPKDAGAGVQGEGDHDPGTKKETGEGGIDVRV
ncbi:MAG TPA: hypothetical protein VFR10_06720 [bacterium]|nr:hypothetical protein [bacterium]